MSFPVPQNGVNASFKNPEVDPIETKLRENLGKCFFDSRSAVARLHLAGQEHRRGSNLYFYRLSDAPADRPQVLAVKVFSARAGGRVAAERQFAALSEAWPTFEDSPTLRIPRPIAFFPELGAIVTEWVSGTSLQNRFKTLWSRKKNLALSCANAGRWLRRYHLATALPARPLDLDKKLDHWPVALGRFEQAGFSPELGPALNDALGRFTGKIRGIALETASVHGDFSVDNVLVDGGRVTVIDLAGKDHNAVFHDLASFLNSLQLTALTWPVADSLIDDCGRAFLDAYFDSSIRDRHVLNFLRLVGLVSVTVEISERRRGQPLIRWWVRHYSERLLRRAIGDMDC